MSERKRTTTNYQYPFPSIPRKWGHDEMQFAQGLRRLFDILFAKKWLSISEVFPVGSVVLTESDTAPYSFGTWEAIQSGISGVYAWKRTA